MSNNNWNNISLVSYLEKDNYPKEWSNLFNLPEIQECLSNISEFLKSQNKKIIYPEIYNVFNAFHFTPINKIKVILLGQDCYHNGNATGLCFDIKNSKNINPSLRNIYKELKNENYDIKTNGNLSHWADNGVLMLNTSLSVEKGKPDSHYSIWLPFTKIVIDYISKNTTNIAWLLMGRRAHQFQSLIDTNKHQTFLTSHPSPFSAHRGNKLIPAFLGSNVFNKINDYLKDNGKEKLNY